MSEEDNMSNNPAGRKLIPVGKADPRSYEEKSAPAEAAWKRWHVAAGTPKAPPRPTIRVK
jgi:hypothetical protein